MGTGGGPNDHCSFLSMDIVYMALYGWKSCGDPESQPCSEAPREWVICQNHTAADSNLALGGVGGLVRIPRNEASLSTSSLAP